MTKYTSKELMGMTSSRLQEIADEIGLSIRFTKNHNKAARAKRILKFLAQQEVESGAGVKSPEASEPSPDFEALCSDADVEKVETPYPDIPSSGHGGARPGAGRPPGMTDEKALYNRLSQQPHPAVKAALELLFDSWAAAAKCDGIRLTKQEAMDIALPWTNVLEIIGVGDKIPPWVIVAVTCGWNTLSIVKAKAALARAAKIRDVSSEEPQGVDRGAAA